MAAQLCGSPADKNKADELQAEVQLLLGIQGGVSRSSAGDEDKPVQAKGQLFIYIFTYYNC